MDATIAALIGVLGGSVIGAGSTIIATRLQARSEKEEKQKDREEKYKAMLYDKRLEIYQEISNLIMELEKSIPDSINELKRDQFDSALEALQTVDDFIGLHYLYFEQESAFAIGSLCEKAAVIITALKHLPDQKDTDRNKEWSRKHDEFHASVIKTLSTLAKCLGMKHVDIKQLKGSRNV